MTPPALSDLARCSKNHVPELVANILMRGALLNMIGGVSLRFLFVCRYVIGPGVSKLSYLSVICSPDSSFARRKEFHANPHAL
jgi:hypothetical protein